MEIYQTKRQRKEFYQAPTELDIYQIMRYRKNPSAKENNYCDRLVAGNNGENIVIDYFNKYGKKHWLGIRNFWLNYYGTSECDLVLMTNNACYIFEIKNFDGYFEYKNGECFLNGNLLRRNCMTQIKRTYTSLQEITHKYSSLIKVYGVLLFIGEHNHVTIDTNSSDIQIIQKNQLKRFIQNIAEEESLEPVTFNPKQLITYYEKFENNNPYSAKPIKKKKLSKLQKGIYCARCKSFNVSIHKHSIRCLCGHIEFRDQAMLRTICELGTLTFNSHLKQSEIRHFINKQASVGYTINILKNHFNMINKNRYTYYENKKLPFNKIKNQFKL